MPDRFRCISCGVRVPSDTGCVTKDYGRLCSRCWTAYLIGRKDEKRISETTTYEELDKRISTQDRRFNQLDVKLAEVVKYLAAKDMEFVKIWDEARKGLK